MNFGSGTKHSLNYVGTNYKQGLLKDGEPLGKDYSRSDILLYSPGKINMFLAKTIEALINSSQTKKILKNRIENGSVLNIFSHYKNAPKNGSKEAGIFFQLGNVLKEIGVKNIEYIHGNVSMAERLKIQARMEAGNIDALVNQWGCTQEGFKEIAGNRPVTIFPCKCTYFLTSNP